MDHWKTNWDLWFQDEILEIKDESTAGNHENHIDNLADLDVDLADHNEDDKFADLDLDFELEPEEEEEEKEKFLKNGKNGKKRIKTVKLPIKKVYKKQIKQK